MEKLILYCKSYSGDVERVKKLKNSIEKYNKDNIPFYVSCPQKDIKLFKDTLGTENYTLVADEEIITFDKNKKYKGWTNTLVGYDKKGNIVEKSDFHIDGWRSQQIVKSNIHKLNITENYLCLDSDCYFIRDFFISDFMATEDTPYTIIHENKEIQQYSRLFFDKKFRGGSYNKALDAYREIFGSPYKKLYDYGPNPYLWSCKVWKHLEDEYLTPNNYTFESFNRTVEANYNIAMREAIVYGEYILNTRIIDIIPTGPFFKVYHWIEMVDFEEKNNLFDLKKLEESYLGVIHQSNIERLDGKDKALLNHIRNTQNGHKKTI